MAVSVTVVITNWNDDADIVDAVAVAYRAVNSVTQEDPDLACSISSAWEHNDDDDLDDDDFEEDEDDD